MAVDAYELHDRIQKAWDAHQAAFENNRTNPMYLKILGDTMKAYFEEKIEVTYGWLAFQNVSGAMIPDPMVQFNSKAKFPEYDLTPSKSFFEPVNGSFSLPSIAILIQKSHSMALIEHPPDFVLPKGKFKCVTPPPLKITSNNVSEVLLEAFCKPVVKWYLQTDDQSPIAGIHLVFTIGGTTTMMKVK